MRHKAWVAFQPSLHFGSVVRSIIVHHEMQGRLARKLSVQPTQELEKLLVPVSFETLPHDAAFKNVECGKQRGRSVPLVVVRHRPAPPLLHQQARLGPVQRLNLTFFIHTQHQRVLGRIQIQTHDIGQLLQKTHIPGQF